MKSPPSQTFSGWHQSPISPAQYYLLMKAECFTIWTAHADNRAFSLTIGPSRCLAVCWGNRAAQHHIGGSEEASDAPGHVPRPPSPHNLACSVPTQWQTHLRWQLSWTLSSGDKCRDHSLLPTQAFNHDALLLLLTPQILYRVKSCYSYILRATRKQKKYWFHIWFRLVKWGLIWSFYLTTIMHKNNVYVKKNRSHL